jgi:hypothetical protein
LWFEASLGKASIIIKGLVEWLKVWALSSSPLTEKIKIKNKVIT